MNILFINILDAIDLSICFRVSLLAQMAKNLPAMQEIDLIPGLGRSPGEGNGSHSSTLALKIAWTEEPGRLQSVGSQRVRHNWATSLCELTVCSSLVRSAFQKIREEE